MKFGFASSVEGIRPETRETAQEAARRAGLPLNEWLNATILQQAAEQGIAPASARAGENTYDDDLSKVHSRLDEITQRIDQVARHGPAAYAPKRSREELVQMAELIGHLERRLDEFDSSRPAPVISVLPLPPSLDRAIAEITTRVLNGECGQTRAMPGGPATPEPTPPPVPTPDLSGLESQLRLITDQIETLRHPAMEEAIQAIRTELAEIGRALNEAMPRQAIEAIEKQIQELTHRIEQGRQAGVDSSALSGIEHRLGEVRDSLHGLMPAENLVGYNEAVNALAHKIDLIVAQKDPETMQRLESSIATLREMAAHVASNEAMSTLAAQVEMLAGKVDRLAIGNSANSLTSLEQRIDALSRALTERPHSSDAVLPRLETIGNSTRDALSNLEQRVDALGRALAERPHSSDAVLPRLETIGNSTRNALSNLEQRVDALSHTLAERPDGGDALLARLETLVQSLSDKIDQIQQSRGDNIALGLLEDRIVKLVERLDTSGSHLGHLEAVERGLADLLVHIEDMRANKEAWAPRVDGTSGIDAVKCDIARTQGTVEAMHGALAEVVGRLTLIEKDIHADLQRPADAGTDIVEIIQTVCADSASAPIDARELLQQPATAALPAPASPLPAASATLADQPLEPGSGPPRSSSHPGARIAASEALLAIARPNASTPAGKADFIAAARRAAQAAGQQDPKSRLTRVDSLNTNGAGPSLHTKVMTRVKSLFLAASVVAIFIGSIQFAGNVLEFGFFDSNDARLAKSSDPDAADTDTTASANKEQTSTALVQEQPEPSSPASDPPAITSADAAALAKLFTPPALLGLTPAAPPPAGAPPLDLSPTGQAAPALAPAPDAPPLATAGPKNDVTGSISRQPPEPKPSRQLAPAVPPASADRLPAGIGSARLRNAALGGDTGAAYEVAMRFAEGRGVPANLEEAARWFERAANKGLTPAQFRFASMLEKGQGVKKDLTAAQKLYVAAADKGHAKSMHNLAVLYAEGFEGKPDYVSAAQWFRKAAEHGVADSQYNLGVLTARGLGTERNLAESYKWFALAAAQNDRDAGRKRDEVAAHLDARTLATAQLAVKNFVIEGQPPEAIAVPEPAGGWDRATPPSSEKPKAAAIPLSMTAFNSGKL